MKNTLLILSILFSFSSTATAQEATTHHKKMPTRFQTVPLNQAQLHQEGKEKYYCPKCGMTLHVFYKTNHLAEVDGNKKQFCSFHCLANALQSDSNVTNIKVVDTNNLTFIETNSSWYVVGSSKMGTMSKVSKYAFSTKEDAQKFTTEFGGEIKSFKETLNQVNSGLTASQEMIQKKQNKMAKKGEMLFSKICQPIEQKFNSIVDAKTYLTTHQPCGNIRGRKLQAIAIYLSKR